MYCYYTANASWTMTQVIDDIAALCSGTLVASLSASCNKPSSYQTGTTISAGWTIHDSDTAQSTKGVVLSCADVDNLTTKYCNIWGSGTSINMRTVEDWNATNNTTTNAGSSWAMSTAAAGVAFSLHIFCTPQYISISFSTTSNNGVFCLEVLRDTPYLNDATTDPLVAFIGHYGQLHAVQSNFYIPRLRNPKTGATLLTTAAGFTPMTVGPRYMNGVTGIVQVNQTTPVLDSSGNSFHQVYPMLWGWLDTAFPNMVYHGRTAANASGYPPMYTRCDINAALVGDTMVVDGVNFMYVSTSYGVLFPIM